MMNGARQWRQDRAILGKVDSLLGCDYFYFILLHHCSMSFCLVPKIIQRALALSHTEGGRTW